MASIPSDVEIGFRLAGKTNIAIGQAPTTVHWCDHANMRAGVDVFLYRSVNNLEK